MSNNKKVKVFNRNAGATSYVIPDLGIHRNFEVGESKEIDLQELIQLSYIPGGEYVLKNCLVINDTDALSALNMDVEPEYFYSDADITKLLTEGTLDQLEDALNFAPTGVIDVIKKQAVEMKLPDTRKRELISEKTGFNIDNAINVNRIMDEEEVAAVDTNKKRKAQPINASSASTSGRKAPIPQKYNVVKKG